jgi:hypothetical protein
LHETFKTHLHAYWPLKWFLIALMVLSEMDAGECGKLGVPLPLSEEYHDVRLSREPNGEWPIKLGKNFENGLIKHKRQKQKAKAKQE